MGAVYSIFQFLLEEKMEAIRQKLKEADNIPEVIDLMLNLRIPNKGCKNIEDMKERMLTHLSSRNEVSFKLTISSNRAFALFLGQLSLENSNN